MNKKKLFFFINSYNYSDIKQQVAELFVYIYKIEKFYSFINLYISVVVIDIKKIFIVYFIELYCYDYLTICNTFTKFISNY